MSPDPDTFWMPVTANRKFKLALRMVKAIQHQVAELDFAPTGVCMVLSPNSASKAVRTTLKNAV